MGALNVNKLCKSYRMYNRPLDRLKEALFKKNCHRLFHSLRDITFSVSRGETLGIVGDNGAGKSTLLKILAGTLDKTSGSVTVAGRVAALLELGSGFHMEFTGRQNIWMNASLMGLEKSAIQQWEPEIIQFSELEEFIDQPIKTYSSGMVVRLAFSIATVVDPDILIIDEALSVGDQNFQKKCVDTMVDIKRRGKTILFCTHSLYLINMLCNRAIWIDKGQMVEIGPAEKVIAAYENFNRKKSSVSHGSPHKADRAGLHSTSVRLKSILINGQAGDVCIANGERLEIEINYQIYEDLECRAAVVVNRSDQLVCHVTKLSSSVDTPIKGIGAGQLRLVYPAFPFCHGEFVLEVLLADNYEMMIYDRAVSGILRVLPDETSKDELGLLKIDHQWIISCI